MALKEFLENIDLDEGKILVNGKWLTEDEIRYAIKMKVESDDYNVAELAVALQTLIDEMNKSAVMKVRVPREIAEEFEKLSKERDESVESVLRSVLIEYLGREDIPAEEPEEDEIEAEIYEDIEMSSPQEILEDKPLEVEIESEADIDILGGGEEEIDIEIEDEDVYLEEEVVEAKEEKEDELEDNLLDMAGEDIITEPEKADFGEELEEQNIMDTEVLEETVQDEAEEQIEERPEEDIGEKVEDIAQEKAEEEVEEKPEESEEESHEEPLKKKRIRLKPALRRRKLKRKGL